VVPNLEKSHQAGDKIMIIDVTHNKVIYQSWVSVEK
jgi:hypothetical protein